MKRIVKDIPELVSELRHQSARETDFVVPAPYMTLAPEGAGVRLEFLTKDGIKVSRGIQSQAHPQIADKLEIPRAYYERMLARTPELLCVNANWWLRRMGSKKSLIRSIDDEVRAVLSARYRPLSHLDLLTTAVQVIAGRDGEAGDDRPWARGARAFTWHLSPTNLDVCLLNPGMAVDLEDLSRGVRFLENVTFSDEPHSFAGAGLGLVFPAARIRNSETGHGKLSVQSGLFEGVCSNSAWLPVDLAQRHLGHELDEEDALSPETYRKMNAAIFSKVADVLRQVFDPEAFLSSCRKFKGLEEVAMSVTEAADKIVRLPGITEAIRDEILAAYQPLKPERQTLLDVQRAVTAVAVHMHNREEHERAFALEDLGGALIEKGEKAITSIPS